MLFIHHWISSGKLFKLNAAHVHKRTILDKTLLMQQSTWVISGRPRFIPLNVIDSRYQSTHRIIESINNLIVIKKQQPDVFTKQRSVSKLTFMFTQAWASRRKQSKGKLDLFLARKCFKMVLGLFSPRSFHLLFFPRKYFPRYFFSNKERNQIKTNQTKT